MKQELIDIPTEFNIILFYRQFIKLYEFSQSAPTQAK